MAKKTLIFDKDISPDAGILTGKLDDTGQDNKFLNPTQLAELTGGVSADAQHYHTGFGAVSAQFGTAGTTIDFDYQVDGLGSDQRTSKRSYP